MAATSRLQPSSRRDLPGDEQKLDMRPTATGELAADSETKPEEIALVDQALGQGHNKPLFGEISERTRE